MTSRLVDISHRVYTALLIAFPRAFREEYGHDMALVFRDSCREAYRQRGAGGLLRYWIRALFDLVVHGTAERLAQHQDWIQGGRTTVARRIELISGFLAGILGFGSLVYAVFGPTGQYSSCTSGGACVSGSRSLWQEGLSTGAIVFISAAVLLCIAVVACAYLHSRYGNGLALVGLWILSALLIGGTVISALSIGVFLVIPTLLTSIAAVAASVSQVRGGGPSPAYSA